MPESSKPKKYGNDHYWFFLETGYSHKEVAIWRGPEGEETIIARATDKYEAQAIVDALLNVKNSGEKKFGKKELAFLEFVESNCPEPYSTMAGNAIMWNDFDSYNKLKSDFNLIY